MKTIYTLATIALLIIMAGCNLDVRMYDGVMAEDLEPRNITELSQGSYRLLKNDGGLIDNGYYFQNYGADDLSWGGTSTSYMFKMYDYGRNIASTTTEYAWELGYRTIGNCNKVIEMGQELGDQITKEQTVMIGENYYLRALCYFLLINEFAQPYSNNPQQNPGLPLKLTSDQSDLPESRSTVAEVYEQIVKDLEDAITYMTLPEGMLAKNSCYATKEAAQALLARVYLYMENYDGAYNMANAVINSGRFQLITGSQYATYPQAVPEDNKETIFAVRRTIKMDNSSYSRPGGLFIRVNNQGWEEIYASSRYMELLELYLDENGYAKDLRSSFITKRYVEDGTNTDIYPITGNPAKNYQNWTFAYARRQTATGPNYEYKQVKIAKQPDGTYRITNAADVALFTSDVIQTEPYNLGTRYYVTGTDGTKYIGRVEPEVYNAQTLRQKDNRFLVYAINKCSYQEQEFHLWSPLVSRLAEMYLIRAEVSAQRGQTQLALDDVNVLRRRAGIPEWTLANMATAENGEAKNIVKIVEEERMLELAWEGHRRFDVFRWRHTMDRKYPGGHTHTEGDKFLEIPYNSPAVCEYIPQAQYDAYPYDLGQNP
ncbi:RagB/SusD family nutrient uptake outer membrane protein [Bacteroides sp. UBA939]|uniref:RagB/SusD family nutrient uptake outer membrane protein n=1 Tax=Bacteroides sp. UBA939 TaxID=1946092 RepID=UPI0025BF6D63|nr:RagB/SusD family nutrient uptake outer membrane protein [Bacteroides sp. UBA939]